MRLLLVEDSPDIAWIVERLARRGGHDLVAAADVPGGWDALVRRGPADLALIDLNLPGARGEELCRRVRADPSHSGTKLCLFSHWDQPADVIAGLEAGAECVVSKELLADPEAWERRLRDCLRGGRDDGGGLRWSVAEVLPETLTARVAALNRALRHPLARQLGAELLAYLLRRALARCGGADAWLSADGCAVEAVGVERSGGSALVAAFIAALADQFWCLYGAAAAAPLYEALGAAPLSSPTS